MTKLAKMKMALVAAAMIAASPALAVTNLITNGSFENGLTGWTATSSANANDTVQNPNGNDTVTTNPSPDAAGSKVALFQTDTGSNTLAQTIALTAGHSYIFGFDYIGMGYQNANPFTFTLAVDSTTLTTLTSDTVSAAQWATASIAATAGSTRTATLSFVFTGSSNYAKDIAIDRVYMIDTTAVPEPATWAMMIGGFGLVGCALRRNRRRASVFA